MQDNQDFRRADRTDLPQVLDLLTQARLPLAGVEAHLNGFVLAFRDDGLIGCAGLERYGAAALLRSVAVAEGERNSGLGKQLVRRLLEQARAEGVESIILLTTTAAAFFQKLGFTTISRAEAPQAVQCSVEFQEACPASATVMRLDLAELQN